MSGQSPASPYGGSAFNFGSYPGTYGGGFGGGFQQPTFSYQNTFTPSGYSNPVNPNTIGQPTSSIGANGSYAPQPNMNFWGNQITSPTGNFNGPHNGGGTPSGPMQPIDPSQWYFGSHNGGLPQLGTNISAPTPTNPTVTPPANPPSDMHNTLGATPKVGQVLADPSVPTLQQATSQSYLSPTATGQQTPNGGSFGSTFHQPTFGGVPALQQATAQSYQSPTQPQAQGPIAPIQQSYNPMGDGYTGTQGQYQIRQNPLIGQALNSNPQAVFQMLGGGGGDPMSRYTNAGNALQGSGFGGGDFGTAFRNLQQALQGMNIKSLSSQYSGLPSYFTGG